MPALDPAIAATRVAVRAVLPRGEDVGRPTVLVACSGGADSLALLVATVFESRAAGCRVVGTVVDHGLQDGSAAHTAEVVAQMAALGVDETASIRVRVDVGPGGVEAGAREARYAALTQLAMHFRVEVVLLGHTLDDQAETVLLGLSRGSGGRSITGMRRVLDRDGVVFARPLLDLTRDTTEAACEAAGVTFWRDPHNGDPRFTRSRVRHAVLPVLERELGPGVAAALARTGEMLRADLDTLDDLAEQSVVGLVDAGGGLDRAALMGLPPALRTRVVRLVALAAGALASDLTHAHVAAVLALGPGKQLPLPGHVTVRRVGHVLHVRRTGPVPQGAVGG